MYEKLRGILTPLQDLPQGPIFGSRILVTISNGPMTVQHLPVQKVLLYIVSLDLPNNALEWQS